jgi:hypothetical protein
MSHVIVWQRVDTPGLEYAEIALDPFRVEGRLVLVDQGEPCTVTYSVSCDSEGMTVQSIIALKRQGVARECRLDRSTQGRWKIDGIAAPQLDGLADVDLSVTPATNTPPIRRLHLGLGQAAEVTAAWVKFPTLEVAPLRQTYRRAGQHLYRYEAPDLSFTTDIECDEEGIVQVYDRLWRRIS